MSGRVILDGRSRPSAPHPLLWLLLVAFAAQGFVGVTVELMPIPLQAELATDFGVSPTEAGWTVAAFSASLAIFSIPVATVLRRVSPVWTLAVGQVALFAATTLSALSPILDVLLVFRGLAGVALGLIWSSVGGILVRLVPHELLPRATSISSAGVTAAFLFGLPASAALGTQLGWQASFVVGGSAMLVVGAVVIVAAKWFLGDARPQERRESLTIPAETGSLTRLAFVGVLTVLVLAAQYASFTYVIEVLPPGTNPSAFLVVFGASGIVSLLVVGAFSRWANWVFVGFLFLLAVAVVLAATVAPWAVTATCWGLAFGAVPPLLSARALAVAPTQHSQVASAVSSSAFQIGILLGSLGGGVVLAIGTWRSPLYLSMALIATGLALSVVIATGARIRRKLPPSRRGRPSR